MHATKTSLSLTVLLALGSTAANAITTTGNNLTVLAGGGTLSGGTNDVTFTWDGTYRTAVVTDGSSNASLSSPTLFAATNLIWHNVNIYGPGVYTFYAGCPAGNPACTTASTNFKHYELTVPAGYLGAHMLFDWSVSQGEDVIQLWKLNSSWDASGGELGNGGISTDPFCAAPLTNGSCNTNPNPNPNPNGNTRYTVWDAVSVDTPVSTIHYTKCDVSILDPLDPSGHTSICLSTSDAIATSEPSENNLYHGTKTVDGPISGYSFDFNLQGLTAPVPLPASVWLFGSGLAGLLAAVRRKSRS